MERFINLKLENLKQHDPKGRPSFEYVAMQCVALPQDAESSLTKLP